MFNLTIKFKLALLGMALLVISSNQLRAQDFQNSDKMSLLVFQKTHPPGDIPEQTDWTARKFSPFFGSGEDNFFQFVEDDQNGSYVHLRSGRNNSHSLVYKKPIDIRQWRQLNWRWKVSKLPKDGDLRNPSADDQAAALCIIADENSLSYKSLCYVWENERMQSYLTSPRRSLSKYIVLRNGNDDRLNTWYAEQRDVLKDYRRFFGDDIPETVRMGVMVDSDDTQTSAESFFKDIAFSE